MIEIQPAIIPYVPQFDGPKWPPESTMYASGTREPVTEKKRTRVIVVDDETLIAETVVEILEQEQFEAVAVSSGLAAVELAKRWRPDIVLSDVIMPGLNGIETGIKIREVAPTCNIVLFSGQAATVDLLEKARERGHRFQIIAKPIKPAQLVGVIRRASEGVS